MKPVSVRPQVTDGSLDCIDFSCLSFSPAVYYYIIFRHSWCGASTIWLDVYNDKKDYYFKSDANVSIQTPITITTVG